MRWASALSEEKDPIAAIEECASKIRAEGSSPDAAFLFISRDHCPDAALLPAALARALSPKHILGCSAGGVIGGGREVERESALALTCAWLPGARLHPFHVKMESMPDSDARPKAWRDWTGFPDASQKPGFLHFCDPYSMDSERMTQGLDFAYPGCVQVGGLASAASTPEGNALFLDDQVCTGGAVGAALSGDVVIDTLVAQGCRPVGPPMRVTKCSKNVLLEVEGIPPLEALKNILDGLSEEDVQLARTSLFLGLLGDALLPAEGKRDFLIRNFVGADAKKGILAVGALLRHGMTVQFHLRDKRTSAGDLEERLTLYSQGRPSPEPKGALLFSCVGRGKRLYGRPGHDSELFEKKLGLPLGGFFCNGEIGPVGGTTYLHGYTSCFGIFRPKNAP